MIGSSDGEANKFIEEIYEYAGFEGKQTADGSISALTVI